SDYTSRSRQFRDALADAMDAAPEDGALYSLRSFIDRCRFIAAKHEGLAGALDALEAVAAYQDPDEALSEAASLFESPGRFRETLFFVRCLDHDAPGALDLMRVRDYVSGAVVPASAFRQLAVDQATVLDA